MTVLQQRGECPQHYQVICNFLKNFSKTINFFNILLTFLAFYSKISLVASPRKRHLLVVEVEPLYSVKSKNKCKLEPCTITHLGDGYMVHLVQVYVPMNNRVRPGTRE